MAKYDLTNEAQGARGIGEIYVDAGKTLHGVELTDEQAAEVRRFGLLKIGGGDEGKLPGLTGKSKADLLKIAKDESVPDVSDSMTVADITSAIELHREG